MKRVLLQAPHRILDPALGRTRAYGGAPGESDLTWQLVHEHLQPRLERRGIAVTISIGDYHGGARPKDTDATFLRRHPELLGRYDAAVSPHYDADLYAGPDRRHVGGYFWDRHHRDASAPLVGGPAVATGGDELGLSVNHFLRRIPGYPDERRERRNPNTSDYHWLRILRARSPQTPGVIVELGVGAPTCHGCQSTPPHHACDPAGAPDARYLRANLTPIADALDQGIAKAVGLPWEIPVAGADPRIAELEAALAAERQRYVQLSALYEDTRADASLCTAVMSEIHAKAERVVGSS